MSRTVAYRERGRRRRLGALAATQPHRRARGREPRRLADDRRRGRVAEHAALAPNAPRGSVGGRVARADRRPRSRDRPGHEALLADFVGLALLVVLETLNPAERLAFVLHASSPCPSTRSPRSSTATPTRRASSRAARRRVRAENTVPDADLDTPREVVEAFPRPRATGTSTAWSQFSTPMSSLEPTLAQPDREKSAGPPRFIGQAMFYSQLGLVMKPALINGAVGVVTTRTTSPSRSERSRYDTEESSRWTGSDPARLRELDLTILD
jgi:hypothetical protein